MVKVFYQSFLLTRVLSKWFNLPSFSARFNLLQITSISNAAKISHFYLIFITQWIPLSLSHCSFRFSLSWSLLGDCPSNTIFIIFEEPVSISCIKLWNYSKTPDRGVKEFEVPVLLNSLIYNIYVDISIIRRALISSVDQCLFSLFHSLFLVSNQRNSSYFLLFSNPSLSLSLFHRFLSMTF